MVANVETMAWTGEVPWHGLGKKVGPDLTPDEMLDEAGLNWRVSKQPIYAHIEVGGKKKREVQSLIEDRYALTRDKDQKVFDIVGDKWKPVQNTEGFGIFHKLISNSGGKATMETAGALDGGRYVWALARLNSAFKIGKDHNHGYFLMALPHIFGKSILYQTTAVRVVCQNTYTAALMDGSNRWSMRHSRLLCDAVRDEALTVLGLAINQFEAFGEQAKFLAGVQIKSPQLQAYFRDVLGEKQPETANENVKDSRQIVRLVTAFESGPGANLASAKGTMWGAFNAVTHVTDHLIGKDQDLRLTRAWFGDRALLKKQALEKAIDYAKAAA